MAKGNRVVEIYAFHRYMIVSSQILYGGMNTYHISLTPCPTNGHCRSGGCVNPVIQYGKKVFRPEISLGPGEKFAIAVLVMVDIGNPPGDFYLLGGDSNVIKPRSISLSCFSILLAIE